ncbi:MAG: contractile injection system protein, VgrG/Pvc8 family [Acidobacteriota bacterium]
MAVADTTNPLVPDFDVAINGSPLAAEVAAHVTEVVVDDSVEAASMFVIEIAGSDAQKKETLWVDDESLFAVGNTVEIKMGYRDNLETLMTGEITGLEPAFVLTRLPCLIVRGYDRRHRLMRGRKSRTFLKQSDSDIAAQIASEAGLTAQAEDSKIVHEYLLQANQSDWDFLRERALSIRYEVIVEDKTLIFRPAANAESETLTLTMDDDLLEFHPRLSSCRQVSEVTARSWNPKDKKEIIGQAKAGDEVSKMGGQSSGAEIVESAFGAAVELAIARPAIAQAEADEQAKSLFNETLLDLVTGEGISRGRTDLRSGRVIKIDGVGKRFSGQYYVASATHRYSPRVGYQTHFTFRRNAL